MKQQVLSFWSNFKEKLWLYFPKIKHGKFPIRVGRKGKHIYGEFPLQFWIAGG